MAVTIKLKRDTAANWTSNNPTLAAGEMGIETDTNKFKFGDGSTAWTSLSYSVGDTNIPLNGLIDVAAQSPNDGDVIQYDSANSKWVTAAPASGSSYGDADVDTLLESNLTADRIQLRTNNAYFGVGTASGSAGMAIKNNGGQPFFYGSKYLPMVGGTDLELEANTGGKINVNGYRVYNVGTPTDNTDAANKAYVDSVASGGGSSYSDSDVSTFLNGNIDGHLIPDTNIAYDLGSPEKKFRYLYLDSSTMYLGDDAVSSNGTTLQMNGQPIIGAVPTTATMPENPVSGDQWFNPATLTLYVYYVDSNSVGAWVEVGGA